MNKSDNSIQILLHIRNIFFSGLLTTVLLGTSPMPVLAQGELEEIVVTARYREENLQETPLAISAISADDLEVRAMAASFEVGYSIPNASLRPAQAAFGNTMTAFIRGIGQNDFNFAFEPGVGIYFDDVYFPTTMGSMIDLMVRGQLMTTSITSFLPLSILLAISRFSGSKPAFGSNPARTVRHIFDAS